MNNVVYLTRTRKRDDLLVVLTKQYNLKTSIMTDREKIIKNDDMIMMIKPKYIFIRIYSDTDRSLLPEIKSILEG